MARSSRFAPFVFGDAAYWRSRKARARSSRIAAKNEIWALVILAVGKSMVCGLLPVFRAVVFQACLKACGYPEHWWSDQSRYIVGADGLVT
jgi:hypothetical protein